MDKLIAFGHFSTIVTKLRVPPQPYHLVHRSRLVDTLERGVPSHALILLSAPAGYGKTTLLTQWAHSTQFRVAWLSLSEEDNDLERFFRNILAAWQEVQPDVIDSPLGLLLSGMSPDIEAVLTSFINVGDHAPGHTIFVLDDYHLIEQPAVHRALGFLLDHLPPSLHFVLAVRGTPPLALARYRARRALLELQPSDLQFRADETMDFLVHLMHLDLSDDQVALLQTQLEGWITGLQLVALTLQRRPRETDQPIVSGKHRFIADYLTDDVLAHLPDSTQRFLLQTSILERLCGPLCDAVTGEEGGQEMLELLERENLFLVSLDNNREWYRYHRLFADFLQAELKRRYPEDASRLHRRASRWHLAHDLPESALRHAVEGDDAEIGVQIVERHAYLKIVAGELALVRRWLDSIPREWHAAHPILDLARAALMLFTGAIDEGIRHLDQVERRLTHEKGDDGGWRLARVTAIRCFIACFQNDLSQAESFAYRALRELPEDEVHFRPGIYGALGDTYRRNGRWEEAKECYLKALQFTQSPSIRIQSPHVFGALADLNLRQGRLRDAASHWQKAIAATREPDNWGRVPLATSGWVYVRMGEVLYEWNELAEAWEHLQRGLKRAELGGDERTMIAGLLIGARLKLTEGDVETAAEYLERTRRMVEKLPIVDWTSRFQRCQLDLWLARHQFSAATAWAREMMHGAISAGQPEGESTSLVVARALILSGDTASLELGLSLVRGLGNTARAGGRVDVLIEVFALEALAHWQRDDSARAMTSLEHALRLAEPEGYVRLFADLGPPLGRLLQEAQSRAVMPGYVSKLLAASSDGLALSAARQGALPEPLTPREQAVLELVAAGLTNREIGEMLVISPQTVKKHTGNIYGKLGAGNRTEAVARAREMDLL